MSRLLLDALRRLSHVGASASNALPAATVAAATTTTTATSGAPYSIVQHHFRLAHQAGGLGLARSFSTKKGGDAGGADDILEKAAPPAEGEQEGAVDGAAAAADASSVWRWLPRKSRKEQGSYVNSEDLMNELEASPRVPSSAGPLYDLRTAAPFVVEPDAEPFEDLARLCEEDPEFKAALLAPEEPPPPPYPGARPILSWELRVVIGPGPSAHPANRKAVCGLYLRDLQEQTGLGDDALQHIARVAGKRYNPNTGKLMLTSERYAHREDNRRHIMETLTALVHEGRRAFPHPGDDRALVVMPALAASVGGSDGGRGRAVEGQQGTAAASAS